ncbi:Uncharacterized protein HZ326_21801 [Fusarium oxysporum f. sp. albedinis]|nr:Uncharacterized protein HZ326_21801 [Fusarium oxysporum f. sp. albedinis]
MHPATPQRGFATRQVCGVVSSVDKISHSLRTSSHLESWAIEHVNGFLFTPEANKVCIDPDTRQIIAIPLQQFVVANQHHCSLFKTTTDSTVPLQDASPS